jgi:hypothetical protein
LVETPDRALRSPLYHSVQNPDAVPSDDEWREVMAILDDVPFLTVIDPDALPDECRAVETRRGIAAKRKHAGAKKLRRQKLEREVVDLRAAKVSWRAIRTATGVGLTTARRWVREARELERSGADASLSDAGAAGRTEIRERGVRATAAVASSRTAQCRTTPRVTEPRSRGCEGGTVRTPARLGSELGGAVPPTCDPRGIGTCHVHVGCTSVLTSSSRRPAAKVAALDGNPGHCRPSSRRPTAKSGTPAHTRRRDPDDGRD